MELMNFQKFSSYCKKNQFKGYDPYDGLNSRLFIGHLRNFQFLGIAITQFFKRCPVNLRPLFLINKEYNPKALALFIKGLVLQEKITEAEKLAEILINLKSDRPYSCWGYNFPWYAKAFVVNKFEPNMVSTVFAANALLDLYHKTKNNDYKKLAVDVKQFLLNELILKEDKDTLCFRYIPKQDKIIHNVNLLGAEMLSRIYAFTKDDSIKELATKSINFSVKKQNRNGSWYYGESKYHKWIDNFHTGYNLCSINRYQKYTQNKTFQQNIAAGLEYHLNNHFLNDLTPKYFNTKLYPIDIHNYAQGIITMLEFNMKEKASQLLHNAIQIMQDKKGYFYYQKNKYVTNKISYMRWAQAWMFYALSNYTKLTHD